MYYETLSVDIFLPALVYLAEWWQLAPCAMWAEIGGKLTRCAFSWETIMMLPQSSLMIWIVQMNGPMAALMRLVSSCGWKVWVWRDVTTISSRMLLVECIHGMVWWSAFMVFMMDDNRWCGLRVMDVILVLVRRRRVWYDNGPPWCWSLLLAKFSVDDYIELGLQCEWRKWKDILGVDWCDCKRNSMRWLGMMWPLVWWLWWCYVVMMLIQTSWDDVNCTKNELMTALEVRMVFLMKMVCIYGVMSQPFQAGWCWLYDYGMVWCALMVFVVADIGWCGFM